MERSVRPRTRSRTVAAAFRWLAGSAGALVLSCTLAERRSTAVELQSRLDAGCAACHADEARTARGFGPHDALAGGPGCLGCHVAHEPDGGARVPAPLALLRTSCEDCHAEVVAQFRLPFHHPLGASVGCTSCHPPHGGTRRELRESVYHDACVKCHQEKKGPFLFEHEGDRSFQCLSCHEAHGSSNPRLLTHHDSRSLCHTCHMSFDDLHIEDPGAVFRECLACHTEIHGSNWDRWFLR
jgi:DmsE family decaheme c-type cytochrome